MEPTATINNWAYSVSQIDESLWSASGLKCMLTDHLLLPSLESY